MFVFLNQYLCLLVCREMKDYSASVLPEALEVAT